MSCRGEIARFDEELAALSRREGALGLRLGQVLELAALPRGALERPDFREGDEARREWRAELEHWRAEAEALCEERWHGRTARADASGGAWAVAAGAERGLRSVAAGAALGSGSLAGFTALQLDAEARQLCRAMASQELELAQKALELSRHAGLAARGLRVGGRTTRASGSGCRVHRFWRGARSRGSRRCRGSARRSGAA